MAGTRLFPNALELRAAAARTSMERIDQDVARARSNLRPLLHHIRTHLFSPGLNVQTMKRACGVRDNSVSTAFGRAIGLPPRPYIEARRLETAERLLRDTALPVHQVGDLVGFSSEAVFYRAFRRWRGEGPRRYRESAQADAAPQAAEGLRPEAIQRALRGRASADETDALIQGLTVAREGAAPAPSPVAAAMEAPGYGVQAEPITEAEELWNELRTLDPEAQRRRIFGLRRFHSGLAELLFVKSRTEGRSDRRLGVHIAKLAVACLYPGGRALLGVDEVELATRRAQAYGWLGNAHRLALEYAEADRAFRVARRRLPDTAMPNVEAELMELESNLRFYECRFDAALSLLNGAEERLSVAAPATQRIARIQIQRSRTVFEAGDGEEAIRWLQSAMRILIRDRNPFLELMAYELLVYSYVRVGKFKDAAVLLPALFELGARQGVPSRTHLWMSGLVSHGLGDHLIAIDTLHQARQVFVDAGERLNAGIVCLDLALVHAEIGQLEQAVVECASAMPLLEVNHQNQELLAAMRIVGSVVRTRRVSLEILKEVRLRFERLRKDPRISPIE